MSYTLMKCYICPSDTAQMHAGSKKPGLIRHFWCQIRVQHHKLPQKETFSSWIRDKSSILLTSVIDGVYVGEKH